MLHISLNISDAYGKSLNLYPMYYRVNNFKEFSEMIRNDALTLAHWASDNYIPKSNLHLFIHIHEDIEEIEDYFEWDFNIKCKNIREYKPYVDLSREDIEIMISQNKRDTKINEIINQ